MIKQHPGKPDGELGVLISLIVSLGMIILAIAGVWLWNTLHDLMGAILSMGFVGFC
ncbi:MAG: hypothetical protein NNA22_11430 [Nitrospira sp.]|nr:hypothetical protein [Nitrospira sp.]